jgi:hypothetical protein
MRAPKGALIHPVQQNRQLLEIKDPPFLAIRQIAITAIEIAE